MCHSKCVEARGQLLRVLSSMVLSGFVGLRFSYLTSMLCALWIKKKILAFEVKINICNIIGALVHSVTKMLVILFGQNHTIVDRR